MKEPPEPPEPDEEPSDIERGMRDSPQGDPRILLVLNVVLSAVFAYTVLWLSDFVGLTEFTLQRVVGFALILILITHIVTR